MPGASRSASTKGGIVNIVVKQNYVGWAGTSTTALEYQNKMGMSENLNLRYGKINSMLLSISVVRGLNGNLKELIATIMSI